MQKRVGLVLSSGGARGVAHIGVIEGLLEEGYEIAAISGSSMGAVIAGVYAAGKLQEFKDWIINLDKYDVFKLMDFTLSTQGFVRGERVFKEMRKFIGDCNIEDFDIPLSIVATDIVNKKEVVFNSGSLYTALRASAAIPSVLMPSILDGKELVDGGVLNPIPIDYINKEDVDWIVVSDVNANVPCTMPSEPAPKPSRPLAEYLERWNNFFPESTKVKRLSYFDLITCSVDLMQDRISDYIIAYHRPDVVVKISRDTCGTFAFYRSADVINYGKSEFKKALQSCITAN